MWLGLIDCNVQRAAHQRSFFLYSLFVQGASLAVVILGVSVLGGWLFDIDWLKRIHPEWATMKANSAFCFICAGFSLWLLNLKATHRAEIAPGSSLCFGRHSSGPADAGRISFRP